MPPKRKENLRDREVAPKMTVHLKPHKKRTDQQLNKETEEFQQNVMNELHKSLNVVFNKYRYEADGLYFDVEYRETKKKINKTVSAFILDVFESHIDDLDDKYEFIFLLDSGGDKKSEKDKSRSRSASISRSRSASSSRSKSRSRSNSSSKSPVETKLEKLKAKKGRSLIIFTLSIVSQKKITIATVNKIIATLDELVPLIRDGEYSLRDTDYNKEKSLLGIALDGPEGSGMSTFYSIDPTADELVAKYNKKKVNGVTLKHDKYRVAPVPSYVKKSPKSASPKGSPRSKSPVKSSIDFLTQSDRDTIAEKIRKMKLPAQVSITSSDWDRNGSSFTILFHKKAKSPSKKGKKSAPKKRASPAKKKGSVGRGRKAKK